MSENDTKPWWSYGHLWMVIGGPAIVIVASFVTLYLAISRPDPVLSTTDSLPHKVQDGKTVVDSALAPAQQARNHAATGVVPVGPKPASNASHGASGQ